MNDVAGGRNCAPRSITLAAAIIAVVASAQPRLAQPLDPITYTVHVPSPDTHYAEVEATLPTSGRASIELMMPVWSPGYYRVENYADRVEGLSARARTAKR